MPAIDTGETLGAKTARLWPYNPENPQQPIAKNLIHEPGWSSSKVGLRRPSSLVGLGSQLGTVGSYCPFLLQRDRPQQLECLFIVVTRIVTTFLFFHSQEGPKSRFNKHQNRPPYMVGPEVFRSSNSTAKHLPLSASSPQSSLIFCQLPLCFLHLQPFLGSTCIPA
uniref:Uncharacterized protein n=1 Tax=Sphaerodactylus townsendi TaxID=933632 RepID=A0ACB8EA54_9SAUR